MDTNRTNNPDIIDIVMEYILNMGQPQQDEGDTNKVNEIMKLIDEKRNKIFDICCKMIDAGIYDQYKRIPKKDNYKELNELEKMVANKLYDYYMKKLIDGNWKLNTQVFNKDFSDFATDVEIKKLGNRVMQAGMYVGAGSGGLINRGTSRENKQLVSDLIKRMVEKTLEDYEAYDKFLNKCDEPLDLGQVQRYLGKYYLDEIKAMQGFYLSKAPRASTAPTH